MMNDKFENRASIPMTSASAASSAGKATLQSRVQSLRLPDTRGAQQTRSAWLPWLLCLLLAGSTGYLGYRSVNQPQPEPVKSDGVPQELAAPTAGVASSGNIALESKGYIIPAHSIQVSPKVGGMITKLYILEEGQRFKKGDVLAEIEKVEYESDHAHARSFLESARQRLLELVVGNRPEEIQAAKAELAETEAQREQLYLDWKRNNSLKTGNALAQREFEQAYSSYMAMDRRAERLRQSYKLMVEGPRKERIDAAKAEVRQAEADVAKTQWRLDNCLVRAPLSGTILAKKAEEGNMVNPSAFSNGLSASLCDMADLSELEVELDVQERDIAKVFHDQRCKIRAEAFPERVYEGTVSRLMPIANRAKGAVPVRVTLRVPKEEEGQYLKPEMGAIVSFMKKEEAGAKKTGK